LDGTFIIQAQYYGFSGNSPDCLANPARQMETGGQHGWSTYANGSPVPAGFTRLVS